MKREIENLAGNNTKKCVKNYQNAFTANLKKWKYKITRESKKGKKMNIKRFLSGIVLFPIFALILIFGNSYVVDIFISIVAIMSLHEFYKAFQGKANPIRWVGYVTALLICFMPFIPGEYILPGITLLILMNLLVLFAQIIITNMKYNINDIAISMLGVCYIVFFLMFVPLIRDYLENGHILIWYVFFAAWGTDIFAYLIGRKFGKHKFTGISPNKSTEGCAAGIVGALLLCLIYTYICNSIWGLGIDYFFIGGIAIFLSVISQIGDLAASSVKRYCEIKDFSNLIPGHGGILDRIDSVIFILPFAYFLLSII